MDKLISKKVVLNTLDLFQNQFGWTTEEDQKTIFMDEFLFLKDFEDNEFVVRAEIKDELWKNGGKIRYSTIITSAADDFINYDINTEVDYFVFLNKKCDQAFICKREDLVQKDNLIFRNQEYEGKTHYNKPCYEIHMSMCELYEKREDGWYEKD